MKKEMELWVWAGLELSLQDCDWELERWGGRTVRGGDGHDWEPQVQTRCSPEGSLDQQQPHHLETQWKPNPWVLPISGGLKHKRGELCTNPPGDLII